MRTHHRPDSPPSCRQSLVHPFAYNYTLSPTAQLYTLSSFLLIVDECLDIIALIVIILGYLGLWFPSSLFLVPLTVLRIPRCSVFRLLVIGCRYYSFPRSIVSRLLSSPFITTIRLRSELKYCLDDPYYSLCSIISRCMPITAAFLTIKCDLAMLSIHTRSHFAVSLASELASYRLKPLSFTTCQTHHFGDPLLEHACRLIILCTRCTHSIYPTSTRVSWYCTLLMDLQIVLLGRTCCGPRSA